jgi:hypothetical protein
MPTARISEELCRRVEAQANQEGITVLELIKKLVSMLSAEQELE